jgi:competence protein ComEC
MRHGVDWLARLPGSDYPLHPIPVPVMILYYAALCAALLPAIPRRLRQLLVIAATTTVLAVPFALTAVAHHHPNETRITILSVGAGSCAVVETDNGQTLLIDAGSTGSSDLYRSIIEPYLRTRGLRHVDAAFISHADFDHYGALADIARTAGVGKTYFTPQFSRDAEDSHAAKSLLHTLKQLRSPTDTLTAGRSLRLSPDTTLDVLWPPPDATDVSTNDSSMVLRLTAAGRSVLFPGDIQDFAMQGLLANPAALRSDVLIAPHHGSLEDATPAFVDAVAPAYIVSSDDSTPSHKQRDFDATITGRPLLHTHACGAITITIRRDGTLAVTPFRSRSSAAAPPNPVAPAAAPATAAP